ncbi:Anthranilate 1,2-dioxygenase system ferredoxin--NAD(+) reductase component [Bradyrhizobium ivorense]|uniref:Anthranilate 1,2-dioxygenase system ferredoxin--NAD(+) reductase component n=1 Tax=Bradyrhizobium ivorense TaxID=2511166 RepID=A0A508TYT5_9BRAD|nr:FAD-dependent oxidoreductase [Bradyrhizobium ivorense]VIO79494.1 Anthranilate 1,2-dioxygenase system ferredoxin--NAD(+) reductase component [Bradyrhizobium ivorense]
MARTINDIVIAGAGQAGARAAEALRARGFKGSITMIGDEPHPPYERPQLSKAMLQSADVPVAYIKQAQDWNEALDIRIQTGSAAIDGDADRRIVSTADGRRFPFDALLLATGTRPRRLPALDDTQLEVQYLRNVEDALRFRRHIRARSRTVIVGGGVIGLEAACAAAKGGCHVTVIENEARLLARAFPIVISDLVADRHRNHGVTFVFGATVTGSSARSVTLSNGAEIAADLVLIGIGVCPSSDLASRLGLPVADGIAVDACGRTAAPGIFCAGDAALQWSRCHGRAIRVETWANAQNQAIAVAANMIGETRDYSDPPWFWTDQYDLNIQVAGDMRDAEHIARGDPDSGRFSIIAMRGTELVGALSVNAAKDLAMLRRIIAANAKPQRADLESPDYDLRTALRAP